MSIDSVVMWLAILSVFAGGFMFAMIAVSLYVKDDCWPVCWHISRFICKVSSLVEHNEVLLVSLRSLNLHNQSLRQQFANEIQCKGWVPKENEIQELQMFKHYLRENYPCLTYRYKALKTNV